MTKNNQMKDKLQTQCELEQDNFGLSNHETFIIMYIIHHKSLVRIWNLIVSIQPKIAKLASNPPRWANHVPTQPKQLQIDEWTRMK